MCPRGSRTVQPVEIVKAFKYRIDPTAGAEQSLVSNIGGSRFAYNCLLGLVKANWDQVAGEKAKSGGERVGRSW